MFKPLNWKSACKCVWSMGKRARLYNTISNIDWSAWCGTSSSPKPYPQNWRDYLASAIILSMSWLMLSRGNVVVSTDGNQQCSIHGPLIVPYNERQPAPANMYTDEEAIMLCTENRDKCSACSRMLSRKTAWLWFERLLAMPGPMLAEEPNWWSFLWNGPSRLCLEQDFWHSQKHVISIALLYTHVLILVRESLYMWDA